MKYYLMKKKEEYMIGNIIIKFRFGEKGLNGGGGFSNFSRFFDDEDEGDYGGFSSFFGGGGRKKQKGPAKGIFLF
jgi:hypothetical protein